ncbi:MAG: DUF362 domain-containing protein [Desulfobacterales bacterium]|nr:DUF362 domain-containing protein [Deltaproteobacteria bacterium]NNL43564.1 DUF362 domain-containing protein [Desulfobacterales bacterium]
MSKVMIHPANYDDVRVAITSAFKLFPIQLAGKKVLIKPNALRSSQAEEGIVTHPAVVKAVVEKVEQMNPASLIVGDNPGLFNYGANEECFEKTGLMSAAKGYYENIGNDSVKVDFNPDFLPTVSLSRAILQADIIISLPKFKTHGLTVLTGAIKNSYGFLPGAQKSRLHRVAGSPERFHEAIVNVFRLRVPDFFIVDAVVGMEGNGPASADLRNIGLILASSDAVALDSIIARMMGVDPDRLKFLNKAREIGLGDYDPDKIEIIGELEILPNFKLPPLGGEAMSENEVVQEMLHSRTHLTPRANPDLCTACGTCIDQCPVSALSMNEDIPVVEDETCIRCFCCQEICPEKAIALT